jgi:tRNA threonylcarbamoyladenosine biosynthesis protein TsaE
VETPTSVRLQSAGPEDTLEIGVRIGRKLSSGDVVLLTGPLGAGKTLLAKGIARGMGISEEISSPTYTIVSEYKAEKTLYHIDLYRVEGREQTDNLGLDDILGSDGVCVVEWGEKLPTDLPSPPIRVHLSMDSPDRRTILVEGLEP